MMIKTSKEFDFFVRTDLSKYKGLYIAIVEDKVVASSDNAKVVWEEAKKSIQIKRLLWQRFQKKKH